MNLRTLWRAGSCLWTSPATSLIKTSALILLAASTTVSPAAVNESFTASSLPSAFHFSNASRFTTSRYTDPASLRFLNIGINMPQMTYIGADGQGKDDGIANMSFYYRKNSTATPGSFVVEYSMENGPFTQIGSQVDTTSTAVWSQWSTSYVPGFSPIYGDNIKIRIRGIAMPSGTGVGCSFLVDDLIINDVVPPAGSANAALSPASHWFGILADGETSQTTLTISNSSEAVEDLMIFSGGFSFEGPDAHRFEVLSGAPTVIPPGSSSVIDIQFTAGPGGNTFNTVGVLKSNDYIQPRVSLAGGNYIVSPTLNDARQVTDTLYTKVTGSVTVTAQTNSLQTGNNQYYIQDDSGADGRTGLLIDDPDFLTGTTVTIGQNLSELTGQLSTLNGIQRLRLVAPPSHSGTTSVVEATILTGNESLVNIQSELVQVNGAFFPGQGLWTPNTTYPFGAPAHGPIQEIYITSDSAMTGVAIPPYNASKTVRGIVTQSGSKAQILPRIPADVTAGNTGTPDMEIDSSSILDFGEWEIYLGRKARQVVISNTGTAPLDWTGNRLEFTGSNTGVFTSSPTSATVQTLWPGTTTSLILYMNPETTGPVTGTVTFYTNDSSRPETTIQLSGMGTWPVPHDWAQHMGNGEHTGRQHFDARVTSFQAPIWNTGNHNLMGSAGPSVFENFASPVPVKVFAWGTAEGNTRAFIKCFNGDTGQLLWQSDPITDLGSSVAFSSWHSMAADKASNQVFLGMGSNIYAYNADSGAFLWKSEPLRAEGGGQGAIVNATVTVGSKYVYQSTYTGFGGTNYLQAFRISDGTEAWFHAAGGQGQETVVYHDDGLNSYIYRMTVTGFYPTGGTGINCHDADTGEVIWTNFAPLDGSQPWFTDDANFGGISFHDGLIIAPTYNFGGTSQLVCVDAYTGALKWQANDSVATDTSPIVIGNTVYLCGHYMYGMGSEVVGFDITTGVRTFVKPVSSSSNMWTVALAATNDAIYFTEGSSWFGSETAGLHMLNPATGDEMAAPGRVSGLTRGSVAIGSDGSIYALVGEDMFNESSGLLCYRAPRVSRFAVEGRETGGESPVVVTGETVTVESEANWAEEMRLSIQGGTPGEWKAFSTEDTVTLPEGDGPRTFIAEFRNGSGESTSTLTLNIQHGSSVDEWKVYE